MSNGHPSTPAPGMRRRIVRAVRTALRWPGPLLAVTILLPRVSYRLHRTGYRATRGWLDARSAELNAAKGGDVASDLGDAAGDDVQELAYVVRLAARFVPDATCLRKALVLRHVLAARGIGSTIRFGVRPNDDVGGYGFHAWVEVDGVVVSEEPESVAGYSVLGDQPPTGMDR